MTAVEAATALKATSTFQQGATTRAAALTWMLWGLAIPLATLLTTVDASGRSFSFKGSYSVVLQLAMYAWAAIMTGLIWNAFSSRPETRLQPAVSLAFGALLVPMIAGVFAAVAMLLAITRAIDGSSDGVDLGWFLLLRPNVLVVGGLWLFVESLGPWLGPARGFTRLVATATWILGLAGNALHLWGINPSGDAYAASFVGITALAGAYLYQRG